ncbi:hypothetical protein TSAR_009882 [Trichomalopsis sarcophagae]|uniref:Uncharacterized protein n=1 Tax=Trichomalopsis sarcophagae TaxID=543379 RepID=A0A232EJ33_9HYME|nr:hypothetical protein TSAR_009882 [Trichomalopsis sarcophagae]
MDLVNYAHWCSIYLHDMLMLENTAPEVYVQFMKGRFTVKKSLVSNTSVATDQALEQTINRDSKSTAGIIGHTRKKETVAIWDLTYHEFLAITNYFKEITYFNNKDEELSLQYLQNRNANPFEAGLQPLRNIITEELVDTETKDRLLNIFGKEASVVLNNQRCLLKYDLTYKNLLFEENGFFKKENNKSSLIRELEKVLVHDTAELQQNDANTCLVIDVMLVMRLLKWKGCKNIRDLADNFCKFVYKQKSKQQTKRIDFVFDSYEDKSLKSIEHIRRCKSDVIVYNSITDYTPLPKQEDKFWGSSQNKILLQKYLRDFIRNDQSFFCDMQLVFSTINDSPSTSINVDLQNLQYSNIEEANTTWIRAGIGATARDIPLHLLAAHYSEELCSCLPVLTTLLALII